MLLVKELEILLLCSHIKFSCPLKLFTGSLESLIRPISLKKKKCMDGASYKGRDSTRICTIWSRKRELGSRLTLNADWLRKAP